MLSSKALTRAFRQCMTQKIIAKKTIGQVTHALFKNPSFNHNLLPTPNKPTKLGG